MIGSNGTGHGALAGLLAEQGVNVLICGGIGGGAQTALTEAGIELYAGAQGNTDQAVESYLKGELVSSGANCDHHHHEEGHSCGSMRRDTPVETAVVADAVDVADHSHSLQDAM